METKDWPSSYREDEGFLCVSENQRRYHESLYEEKEIGRVLGTHALLSLQMFHFILYTYIYVYVNFI